MEEKVCVTHQEVTIIANTLTLTESLYVPSIIVSILYALTHSDLTRTPWDWCSDCSHFPDNDTQMHTASEQWRWNMNQINLAPKASV